MKQTPYPIDLSVMQTALKDHRKSIGKETERHHYANEVGLINFAITGNRKSCIRELSISQQLLKTIRRIVCENIKLINLHVAYEDRKKFCRNMFLQSTPIADKN